jgi:hypothetical protein
MEAGNRRRGRPGRPWAPLKGDDPAVHGFVNHLRGLADQSDTSLQDIAAACGCSRTTVSKRLDGQSLPDQKFVEDLVRACTPHAGQADNRINAILRLHEKATQNLGRSRLSDRPELNGTQLHTHLVVAQ